MSSSGEAGPVMDNASRLKSAFCEFKTEFVSATLLESFNTLTDLIKHEAVAIDAFAEAVGITNLVKDVNSKSTFEAKSLALSNEYSSIKLNRDQLLAEYAKLNEAQKGFVSFLFFSPKRHYEYCLRRFSEGVFEHGFDEYIKAAIREVDDESLFGEYSIVDCLTNSAVSSTLTSMIDLSIDNGEVFWAKLALLDYGKCGGSNKVTSFRQGLAVMSQLAPVWNQLKISSQTMNADEMSQAVPHAPADINSVVAAYRGDYSVIPRDYPEAKAVSTGLVSNFAAFNKLSDKRKRQVSNYLLNNRARFNEVLQDATQIVSNQIERDAESGKAPSDMLARRATNVIRSSYTKVKGGNLMAKANYIVACFIPLTNKLKCEVMNANPVNAQHSLEAMANQMAMFEQIGGGIYDGSVEETEEVEVKVPEAKRSCDINAKGYEPFVLTGGSTPIKQMKEDPFDQIYSNYLLGGDLIEVKQGPEMSPEEMLAEYESIQRDFNREYVQIYRKIISDLDAIVFKNVYQETLNKLYPLVRSFNDIMIKKRKTTIYLSGVFGKKNRNNAYRKAVDSVMRTLRESNVPQFAPVIGDLEALSKLLIKSAERAREVRVRFVNSPRISSALLIEASKRVKIPCSLEASDFNNVDEAIARLLSQLRSTTSQSTVMNDQNELRQYMAKVKCRADLIKAYFVNEDASIDYAASSISSNRLRESYKRTKKMINEQLCRYTLYVNDIVEMYLTKERLEAISKKTLSKKDIKEIETSIGLFRKHRYGDAFYSEVEKLNKLMASDRNVFDITAQLAKVFEQSRYIDFIASIFRTTKLIDEKFNWDEFSKNMISFMVLSSIDVDFAVELPKVNEEGNRAIAIRNWCQDLAAFIAGQIGKMERPLMPATIDVVISSRFNESGIMGIISKTIESLFDIENRVKENFRGINIKEDLTVSIGTLHFDYGANPQPRTAPQEWGAGVQAGGGNGIRNQFDNLKPLSQGMRPVYNTALPPIIAVGANDEPCMCLLETNEMKRIALDRILSIAIEDAINVYRRHDPDLRSEYLAIDYTLLFPDPRHVEYDANLYPNPQYPAGNLAQNAQNAGYFWHIINGTDPKTGKKLIPDSVFDVLFGGYIPDPAQCAAARAVGGAGAINVPQDELETKYNVDPDRMGTVLLSSTSRMGKNSQLIIEAVFDSLVVNIVELIDKYWEIRYSGNLELPLELKYELRGGSRFDAGKFHDISNAEVIPEAVPFYITALNVCSHYIKTLGSKGKHSDKDILDRHLKMSNLSILYPISRIFEKYDATVDSISMNQLTECVSIFNEIWAQAKGTNEQKLSVAIDILLKELNASIFLGNEVEDANFDTSSKGISSYLKARSADAERVMLTIQNVYEDSFEGATSSPEEERSSFERLMRTAMDKVRKAAPTSRMTELRTVLTDKAPEDGSLYEYYKFMDLVIAPLVVCVESYYNVFRMFEMIITKQSSNLKGEMDLRKYNIGVLQFSAEWMIEYNNAAPGAGLAPITVQTRAAYSVHNAASAVADQLYPRFVANRTVNFWEYITTHRLTDEDIRDHLEDSPIVQKWNVFQFNKMLEGLLKEGQLKAPAFWYVWDRNSYPMQPECSFDIPKEQAHSVAIEYLKTVFDEINGNSVADYLEYAVKEFCNDFDQVVHLFMSYPGISDKAISILESTLHDKMNVKALMNSDDVKHMIELAKTVPIKKQSTYFYPDYKLIKLPVHPDGNIVYPAFNPQSVNPPTAIPNNMMLMEGSDEGIVQIAPNTFDGSVPGNNRTILGKSGTVFRNGWVDWVISMIASAHPNGLIPFKLAQLITGHPVLGLVCKPMIVGEKTGLGFVQLDISEQEPVFVNLVTQNVLARSYSQSNQMMAEDYGAFGQNSVNSIISMIPFLVSQISSVVSRITPTTEYHGIRVMDECLAIKDILTKFFAEIAPFMTPIKFMQDSISSFDVEHPIGELVTVIDKKVSEIKFSSMEWANMYKFRNTNLTFPNFRSNDVLKFIHNFAENIFKEPVFRSNFGIVFENMAKQSWNSILSNTFQDSSQPITTLNKRTIDLVRRLILIYMGTGSTSRAELDYLLKKLYNEKVHTLTDVSTQAIMRLTGGAEIRSDFKVAVDAASEQMSSIDDLENVHLGKILNISDVSDSVSNLTEAFESGVNVYKALGKVASIDLDTLQTAVEMAEAQSLTVFDPNLKVANDANQIPIGPAAGQQFGQNVEAIESLVVEGRLRPEFMDRLLKNVIRFANRADAAESAVGAQAASNCRGLFLNAWHNEISKELSAVADALSTPTLNAALAIIDIAYRVRNEYAMTNFHAQILMPMRNEVDNPNITVGYQGLLQNWKTAHPDVIAAAGPKALANDFNPANRDLSLSAALNANALKHLFGIDFIEYIQSNARLVTLNVGAAAVVVNGNALNGYSLSTNLAGAITIDQALNAANLDALKVAQDYLFSTYSSYENAKALVTAFNNEIAKLDKNLTIIKDWTRYIDIESDFAKAYKFKDILSGIAPFERAIETFKNVVSSFNASLKTVDDMDKLKDMFAIGSGGADIPVSSNTRNALDINPARQAGGNAGANTLIWKRIALVDDEGSAVTLDTVRKSIQIAVDGLPKLKALLEGLSDPYLKLRDAAQAFIALFVAAAPVIDIRSQKLFIKDGSKRSLIWGDISGSFVGTVSNAFHSPYYMSVTIPSQAAIANALELAFHEGMTEADFDSAALKVLATLDLPDTIRNTISGLGGQYLGFGGPAAVWRGNVNDLIASDTMHASCGATDSYAMRSLIALADALCYPQAAPNTQTIEEVFNVNGTAATIPAAPALVPGDLHIVFPDPGAAVGANETNRSTFLINCQYDGTAPGAAAAVPASTATIEAVTRLKADLNTMIAFNGRSRHNFLEANGGIRDREENVMKLLDCIDSTLNVLKTSAGHNTSKLISDFSAFVDECHIVRGWFESKHPSGEAVDENSLVEKYETTESRTIQGLPSGWNEKLNAWCRNAKTLYGRLLAGKAAISRMYRNPDQLKPTAASWNNRTFDRKYTIGNQSNDWCKMATFEALKLNVGEKVEDQLVYAPMSDAALFKEITNYIDTYKQLEAELIDSDGRAVDFEMDYNSQYQANADLAINNSEEIARRHGVVLGYGYNYAVNDQLARNPDLTVHENWTRMYHPGALWSAYDAELENSDLIKKALRLKTDIENHLNTHKQFVEGVLEGLLRFNYQLADLCGVIAARMFSDAAANTIDNVFPSTFNAGQNVPRIVGQISHEQNNMTKENGGYSPIFDQTQSVALNPPAVQFTLSKYSLPRGSTIQNAFPIIAADTGINNDVQRVGLDGREVCKIGMWKGTTVDLLTEVPRIKKAVAEHIKGLTIGAAPKTNAINAFNNAPDATIIALIQRFTNIANTDIGNHNFIAAITAMRALPPFNAGAFNGGPFAGPGGRALIDGICRAIIKACQAMVNWAESKNAIGAGSVVPTSGVMDVKKLTNGQYYNCFENIVSPLSRSVGGHNCWPVHDSMVTGIANILHSVKLPSGFRLLRLNPDIVANNGREIAIGPIKGEMSDMWSMVDEQHILQFNAGQARQIRGNCRCIDEGLPDANANAAGVNLIANNAVPQDAIAPDVPNVAIAAVAPGGAAAAAALAGAAALPAAGVIVVNGTDAGAIVAANNPIGQVSRQQIELLYANGANQQTFDNFVRGGAIFLVARDVYGNATCVSRVPSRASLALGSLLNTFNPAAFSQDKTFQAALATMRSEPGMLTGGAPSVAALLAMTTNQLSNVVYNEPFTAFGLYKAISNGKTVRNRIALLNALGRGACGSFLKFVHDKVYVPLKNSRVTMLIDLDDVIGAAVQSRTVAVNLANQLSLTNNMAAYPDFDIWRLTVKFNATFDHMLIPGTPSLGGFAGEFGSVGAGATAAFGLTAGGQWLPAAPANTERRWEYLTAWLLNKSRDAPQNTRDLDFIKTLTVYKALFTALVRERERLLIEELASLRLVNGNELNYNIALVLPGAGFNRTQARANGSIYLQTVPPVVPVGPVNLAAINSVDAAVGAIQNRAVESGADIVRMLNALVNAHVGAAAGAIAADTQADAAGLAYFIMSLFKNVPFVIDNTSIIHKYLTAPQAITEKSVNYKLYNTADLAVTIFPSNIQTAGARMPDLGLSTDVSYPVYSHAIRYSVNNTVAGEENGVIVKETSKGITVDIPLLRTLELVNDLAAPLNYGAPVNTVVQNGAELHLLRDVQFGNNRISRFDVAVDRAAVAIKRMNIPGGVTSERPVTLYFIDLRQFLTDLIDKDVNAIAELRDDGNSGFLVFDPSRIKLHGGALDSSNLLMANDGHGENAIATMRYLYSRRSIPYYVYGSVFNGNRFIGANASRDIFRAAMRYFHKHNISFNSIFNNLCYAELLSNKVILSNAVEKLSAVAERLPSTLPSGRESVLPSPLDLSKVILSNSSVTVNGKKVPFWDYHNKYWNVFETRDLTTVGTSAASSVFCMTNFGISLSIRSSYMIALMMAAQRQKYGEKGINRFIKVFQSSALSQLMRLDQQCTYITSLIQLMKSTSFYSTDEEAIIPFQNSGLADFTYL